MVTQSADRPSCQEQNIPANATAVDSIDPVEHKGRLSPSHPEPQNPRGDETLRIVSVRSPNYHEPVIHHPEFRC